VYCDVDAKANAVVLLRDAVALQAPSIGSLRTSVSAKEPGSTRQLSKGSGHGSTYFRPRRRERSALRKVADGGLKEVELSRGLKLALTAV